MLKKIILWGFILAGLCFAACSFQDFGGAKVRIAMESTSGQAGTAFVFIEAKDGNLLTGANVVVCNSLGVSSLLKFSYSEGAYTAPLPPGSDGEYTFTVQSTLFSEPYTRNLNHFVLTTGPRITLLQDESAHSALTGSKLTAGEKINVQWEAVAHAAVYQVQVSGDALFAATTTGRAITLPALNSGKPGNYTVMVTAQFISGDPLFLTDNAYSFSEKAGTSVLMLTQ